MSESNDDKPDGKREWFGGFIMILLGTIGTVWVWERVINEKSYYTILAFSPTFLMIGLYLILFPNTQSEFPESPYRLKPAIDMKLPWSEKAKISAAFAAGIANWIAIEYWH